MGIPGRGVHPGVIAVSAAFAGVAWRELFGLWSRHPALWLFEFSARHLGIVTPPVVMISDLLFSLLAGLSFAQLFVHLVRPHGYAPEAMAVGCFLIALLSAAQLGEEGAGFILHLPPLWLSLMVFGIRVGYGIKAERKRLQTV